MGLHHYLRLTVRIAVAPRLLQRNFPCLPPLRLTCSQPLSQPQLSLQGPSLLQSALFLHHCEAVRAEEEEELSLPISGS